MSTTWSLANADTGYFVGRTVSCDVSQLAKHTPAGLVAVEGAHDHLCRRVCLETRQVEPFRPDAPADDDLRTWTWDESTERWVPVPTLAAVRQQRWEVIKLARDAASAAPVMATPFGDFDADAASVDKLTRTVLVRREAEGLTGALLPPTRWTMADNGAVDLTTDQMAQVAVMLFMRGDGAHQVARALRDRIDAATTPDEVEAVEWPASELVSAAQRAKAGA